MRGEALSSAFAAAIFRRFREEGTGNTVPLSSAFASAIFRRLREEGSGNTVPLSSVSQRPPRYGRSDVEPACVLLELFLREQRRGGIA